MQQQESEEEREKKTKKVRRPKGETIGSGDEAAGPGNGTAEPKKRRPGKLRKTADNDNEEEEALSSGDEEAINKPSKKVCYSVSGLN